MLHVSAESTAHPITRYCYMQPLPVRFLFLITALLAWLSAVLPAAAQGTTQAARLSRLDIDIWPDFDRPAALVLLTIDLPAGQPLPATLTLPLPAVATLNAVARITPEGTMIDDLTYQPDPDQGTLTVTTTAARLRIEYYLPYATVGTGRTVDFAWQAGIDVDDLTLVVQQPAAADTLTLSTPAQTVAPGQDGLQYHALPAQALAAGDTYRLTISYNMPVPTLTVDLLEPVAADQGAAAAPVDQPLPQWALIAVVVGVVLVAGVTAGVVITRSSRARRPPARPRRRAQAQAPVLRGRDSAESPTPSAPTARFCHQCGTPADSTDRFCSRCGTALKR